MTVPEMKSFVTPYPAWTAPILMCGLGVLGGALVGYLTAESSGVRQTESIFIVGSLLAVVISTLVRLRFRVKARARFAAAGGNPSTLYFY